jgi:hypothetical protein
MPVAHNEKVVRIDNLQIILAADLIARGASQTP